MSEISIKVGGNTFLGWKEVQIAKSLDALCASFSLTYIDAWNYQKTKQSWSSQTGWTPPVASFEKWYLKAGDPCSIFIDDELILTGFIDEVSTSYSGESRTFSVTGRDKTCDLVDCSAGVGDGPVTMKSYQGITVAQAAKLLIAPFGIELVEKVPSGKKLPVVTIDHGATVFDVIENAAKQRGILFTTDQEGRLVMDKPGRLKAICSLIEGENILEGSSTFDLKRRFSKYTVYGQTTSTLAGVGPAIAGKGKASATDQSVARFRPKIITAERQCTTDECTLRAQWEAKYQAAKSVHAEIKTNEWRQGLTNNAGALGGIVGGLSGAGRKLPPLWDTNMKVHIDAPELGLKGEMLIESVQFILSEAGEITTLGLTRPDAWVPNPIVKVETGFIYIPPASAGSGAGTGALKGAFSAIKEPTK